MVKLSWIALRSPEHSLSGMIARLRSANRCSGPMWNSSDYPSVNALETLTRIDVSGYFFHGRRDCNTPVSLIERYVKMVDAPQGQEEVKRTIGVDL